jgi:hypothetical protein
MWDSREVRSDCDPDRFTVEERAWCPISALLWQMWDRKEFAAIVERFTDALTPDLLQSHNI